MSQVRRLQKQQTRRAILDAALMQLSPERSFVSLSLREVAREAGIAPTSFYRHFRDMDELGLALVEEGGLALRQLMRQARQRAMGNEDSVIRISVEIFMEFLHRNANLFRLILRERSGGSASFRQAIQDEIRYFTDELSEDMARLAVLRKRPIMDAWTLAEAIVTIVFTQAGEAMDLAIDEQNQVVERIMRQLRFLVAGAEELAKQSSKNDVA